MSRRQDRTNLRTHPLQIVSSTTAQEWRAVPDFPGYFVSDLGRVCSVDRVLSNDKVSRGRLLRPGAKQCGHVSVALGRGNSKDVHVLVLTAFRGPCPEGFEGLHYDDDPANNVLTNLRWGTRSANLHDAVRNGKRRLGEDINHSRLTEDGVRFIRANADSSMNSLANLLGVSCAAVKQVRDGVTWRHVT